MQVSTNLQAHLKNTSHSEMAQNNKQSIINSHKNQSKIITLQANQNNLTLNTTKLSATQKQIYSHSIIRSLIKNSEEKTVKHAICQFSPETQLYRKYRTKSLADSTHLKDLNKMDERKLRVKTMYSQLAQQTPTWLKIETANKTNKYLRYEKKEHLDAKKMKHISISGLITYNFTSVKARTRLAYNPASAQQFTKEIDKAQRLARASTTRAQNIQSRQNPQIAKLAKDINDAIAFNYKNMTTEDYLSAIRTQKQNSTVVYGEKTKNLNNTSQYMSIQQTNQDQAEFVINQLKKSARPVLKLSLKNHNRRGYIERKKVKEEQIFQARRIPINLKSIIVSGIQV